MAPDTAGPGTGTPGTRTPGTTTVPSTAAPRTTTSKATTPAGFTVVLDPGHNGGNASHPEVINQLVPAGRGRTKPCNTVGTSTDAGYAEHAFTWDVALRVRELLTARGVRVVLTRSSDTGVGPCVDERAAIGNAAAADAVVSIHADGAAADARGFHVAYSSPPLNAAQGEPAHSLAAVVRDAMTGAGFPTANYIGSGGLDGRDDLAGLNLSERPAVLVECANMRNPGEAATVSSAAGRARYAAAIAAGILRWLGA
jgi:N-acetylmuramoyl-L-alanine amidase